MSAHIKPDDMDAEQHAEWERMNAGGLFPEGLPNRAHFAAGPAKGDDAAEATEAAKPRELRRPPFRPTRAEKEELERLDAKRRYHQDEKFALERKVWHLEKEELTEAAVAGRRAELQRELRACETDIIDIETAIAKLKVKMPKLKATKKTLQTKLRDAGRNVNRGRANDAKLKRMRSEAAKHEKITAETRKKLVEKLAFLNATDDEYMNFFGKTKDMLK